MWIMLLQPQRRIITAQCGGGAVYNNSAPDIKDWEMERIVGKLRSKKRQFRWLYRWEPHSRWCSKLNLCCWEGKPFPSPVLSFSWKRWTCLNSQECFWRKMNIQNNTHFGLLTCIINYLKCLIMYVLMIFKKNGTGFLQIIFITCPHKIWPDTRSLLLLHR